MNDNLFNIKLYKDLEAHLASSTAAMRKVWAAQIIENETALEDLSKLLHCHKKTALRFSWLLTEIGILNPNKLLTALPYLLEQSEPINHFNFKESFATYWLTSGVPVENESVAIDLLFNWVKSGQVKVTTKSRSLKVLCQLAKKYPELKNELSVYLNDQIDKNNGNLQKEALNLLTELQND